VHRAFTLKELPHSPTFAVSYEDAEINWKTGRVTLTRGDRRPFTPTALAQHFERHFADILAGSVPPKDVTTAAPAKRLSPTPKDEAAFREWWAEQESQLGSPPTRQSAEQFARERGLSRDWARTRIRTIPREHRRQAGGQRSRASK
jgi:hypothetical protein